MDERNARVEQVWTAVVGAMRDVVAKLEITEDELHQAAVFFDTMGQERNFHTLLDATLSTASNEQIFRSKGVSHSNVEGPVWRSGAPLRPDGVLADDATRARFTPLELTGRVYDIETGAPVAAAELDVWHADENGVYDRAGFNMRGVVITDENGRYTLTTVLPADYPSHFDDTITQLYAWIGRGTLRAAHVHFKVYVDGVHLLTTQVFRGDSTRLDDDLVIGIVKPELISDVIAAPAGSGEPWRMTFDMPVNLKLVDAARSRDTVAVAGD